MADVFAGLVGGVRFDRRRFQQDLEAFQPQGADSRAAAAPAQSNHASAPAAKQTPEEAANLLRKRHGIKAQGSHVPTPLVGFDELGRQYGCPPRISARILELGYADPTPIQRQALPAMLQGRDMLAVAPTGSGKTLAFLLPIVLALKRSKQDAPTVRAVILSPTKELAAQTGRELARLATGTGTHLTCVVLSKAQAKSRDFLAHPVDIIISTPLRLKHLIEEQRVSLSTVSHLVLDEADKLLEMGFIEQIDGILAASGSPTKRSNIALFTATLPEGLEELARTVTVDPIRVVVGVRNTAANTIEQRLMFVGTEEGKLLAIRQLLCEGMRPPALIFLQSKERAKELFNELKFDNLRVDVIHSDCTAAKRASVVERFRAGEVWVLIATDVMARGMDFKGVNCVINFDVPQSTASYIHRIGRSGRAGRTGLAITLYTEQDTPMLRSLANVIAASGGEVPEWMRKLPKQRKPKHAKPPERESISTLPKFDRHLQQKRREMIAASKKRKRAAET
eukprot:jgi/Chlat1/2535/Chrsp175S02387